MHILSCRHANQEEKSEIRNRLEGLKKGKHPMAVFSSTPTHTVQNEDRTQSLSSLTNSSYGHSLSAVLTEQIAALKQRLGM